MRICKSATFSIASLTTNRHAGNKLFCKEAAKSEAIQESFQRDRQRFAAFDEASRALQHHVDAYIASMASKPALPAIFA